MLILFITLGITITIKISDVSAASNPTTPVNHSYSLKQTPDSKNSIPSGTNSSVNSEKGVKAVSPRVTFNSSQINDASSEAKAYIETNHRLPDSITISNHKLSIPQFLQLLTYDLLQVNNGSSSPIVLKTVKTPSKSSENVRNGLLTKSEYLTLAKQIETYINSYGKAPPYVTTSLGKIGFENLIYTYSKVMNFYDVNNRLPNQVSVDAFSTYSGKPSEGDGATVNMTGKYINMNNTPPKNGYSAYNIIITPKTVTATAKCSCGKGTYTYQTKSFVNYCPKCHRYGTLTYSKPGAEGNWTCSNCDCDYCMQCGKEKISGSKIWLTPA